MREVGIHLTDHIRICRKGFLDAVKVSSPQPSPSRSVQDRYTSIASRCEIVSQRPSPIRRSIVHDENAQLPDREELLNELRQILALVVGRDDNQGSHDPMAGQLPCHCKSTALSAENEAAGGSRLGAPRLKSQARQMHAVYNLSMPHSALSAKLVPL